MRAHLCDHRRDQSKQRRGLSLSVESDPGHIALSLTVHKWVRTEYLHKLRPCLPNPTPLHRLLKRLPEGFQKQPPIIVTLENVLPAVAPVHHVVDGPRILHSHRARHAPRITKHPFNAKGQQRAKTNLRFDPFPGNSFTHLPILR